MSRFYQIHMLTTYPPSNLNRDDSGRPKTAIVGGTTRLRVSSQSLKRAWRTSEAFQMAIQGATGRRSRRFGFEATAQFLNFGIPESEARQWGNEIAHALVKAPGGKPSKPNKGQKAVDKESNEASPASTPDGDVQLVHLSAAEFARLNNLIQTVGRRRSAPTKEELASILGGHPSVDIAMFGRMLADLSHYSVDAAVQVAHAFTVHPVTVEDDYFTAVDDLSPRDEKGAGHLNVQEFGAGTFYSYVCIDRDSLVGNLGGDEMQTDEAICALVAAMATVSPSGKQNSFASRAYADYILIEKGDRQPRSLSVAFLQGIRGEDALPQAIKALESRMEAFDKAYGVLATDRKKLNVVTGEGTLDDLKKFVRS